MPETMTRRASSRSAPIVLLSRLDLVLIAIVIALAIYARALPGPRTIDDAFITFRYSRNIVEGQGFVYNPGSHVLGTTTPFFTVLMAAGSGIVRGHDFPLYAISVSALADACTCVFLFLLARRLTGNRWVGAMLGALWAIAPWSVSFAVGGMETSTNIFWLVGATWWFVSDHPGWMGIFAALGLFTRIDAVIWIGPLFAYQLFEWWRRSTRRSSLSGISPTTQRDNSNLSPQSLVLSTLFRTWLAFGVVILPWLIFSFAYFGSPVPRSLFAKTKSYHLEPLSALNTLIPSYATPFFENVTFGAVGAMVAGLIYLTLSIFGLLYAARRLPRLLPFLTYPWLYLLIFSIANPLIFRWYLAPPLPPLMLGIIAGVWTLIEALQNVVAKIDRRRLFTAVTTAPLAPLLGRTPPHA